MRDKLLPTIVLASIVATMVAGEVPAQGSLFDRAKGFLGTMGATESQSSGLSIGDIASGLREALKVGTERVVARLGRRGGFNTDPEVHIPLPDTLKTVQSALSAVGMSGLADDLELRLNRAAEAATPRAKELFWGAIAEMTLEDARRIYEGPDDAATRYFQGKMSGPLATSMAPVVESALSEAGAVQAYDRVLGEYESLPFVPDVKADLTAYVVEKGLDGIFHYLAKEEAAIRQSPEKRTTELLRRVFGSS